MEKHSDFIVLGDMMGNQFITEGNQLTSDALEAKRFKTTQEATQYRIDNNFTNYTYFEVTVWVEVR